MLKSARMTALKDEKTRFIGDFPFNAQGLEDAQRFILQTIVDNREVMDLRVLCYFYRNRRKKPHCMMEFVRFPGLCRATYGTKGQNEMRLMREMQRWRGEGLPQKSDVIADLHGKNFHVRDFQKFRKALETAGVKLEKSYLNYKVVLNKNAKL